jgi:hypothetical protein
MKVIATMDGAFGLNRVPSPSPSPLPTPDSTIISATDDDAAAVKADNTSDSDDDRDYRAEQPSSSDTDSSLCSNASDTATTSVEEEGGRVNDIAPSADKEGGRVNDIAPSVEEDEEKEEGEVTERYGTGHPSPYYYYGVQGSHGWVWCAGMTIPMPVMRGTLRDSESMIGNISLIYLMIECHRHSNQRCIGLTANQGFLCVQGFLCEIAIAIVTRVSFV